MLNYELYRLNRLLIKKLYSLDEWLSGGPKPPRPITWETCGTPEPGPDFPWKAILLVAIAAFILFRWILPAIFRIVRWSVYRFVRAIAFAFFLVRAFARAHPRFCLLLFCLFLYAVSLFLFSYYVVPWLVSQPDLLSPEAKERLAWWEYRKDHPVNWTSSPKDKVTVYETADERVVTKDITREELKERERFERKVALGAWVVVYLLVRFYLASF